MKAIYHLNNEERVRLLVDLFPEMKPVILEEMENVATDFLEREEQMHEQWNNPLVYFHEWKGILAETLKVIGRSRSLMLKNNKQFSNLTMLGFRGLFTADCILGIAGADGCSKQFRAIAYALFNVEQCYGIVDLDFQNLKN